MAGAGAPHFSVLILRAATRLGAVNQRRLGLTVPALVRGHRTLAARMPNPVHHRQTCHRMMSEPDQPDLGTTTDPPRAVVNAPNGGYLKSSLSTPHLTRTSAA